jgi:glycosyltransferase involved in cell wall biosynthesis
MGSGSAVPSLKKLTAKLELEPYISFTGSIPYNDLPRYVSACDICIDPDPYNPYNDRSTMVKMMDYMAMAKPIVAFDLTEHRASAGQAALYSNRNDIHDFAKTIVDLIENPELQKTMGEIGRQRMIDKFAWHHQENQLLKAYSNIGFEALPKTSPANSFPPNTSSTTELVSK